MTIEYEALRRHLESGLNRYALATSGVEFLFECFSHPEIQAAFSHVLSRGTNVTPWRGFQRFVVVEGKEEIWWGPYPIPELLPHRETIIWDLVGQTVSRFVGDVDYYLAQVLRNHFATGEITGSAWNTFERTTRINLVGKRHGDFVYTAIQERHKVEHNRSVVDERFIRALQAKGIPNSYSLGDRIQRGHFDVMKSYQAFSKFAADVDAELEALLAGRKSR